VASKRIVATRDQGMRFVVSTGSGHEVVVDDGVSNTGARPTEFVLVGLAACTGMDVIAILEKKRQVVTAYEVMVLGIQRMTRPDVFTRIDVVHDVTGPAIDTVAVRRSIELSAWKYCPVSAMLCAGTVEMHHRYRIHREGDLEPEEGEVVTLGPGYNPAPDELIAHG
jgi:putative redox protein